MMDKSRLTCNQKICFIFDFFPKQAKFNRKKGQLNSLEPSDSQSIRAFKLLLAERLERIACMVDILQKAHEDWRVSEKKNKIFLETETFDFNDAVERLANEGFRGDEYLLKVDYERKWGML